MTRLHLLFSRPLSRASVFLAPLLLLSSVAFAQDRQHAVEAECARITKTIEKYLGPKFKAPVPVKVVTRKWMVDFARKQEESFTPPGVAAASERFLKRLKQIPADYDLAAKSYEMLQTGIAGLYDPVSKTYYVAESVGGPGAPMFTITATHELVHAYRDVDKDYHQRMLRTAFYDFDWAFAVTCLVEGDAWMLGEGLGRAHFNRGTEAEPMVAGYARVANRVSNAMFASLSGPPLNKYPRAITESIVGRYAAGLVLAAAIYKKGGKEALAAAYDQPPRSMEQVLHPEKYLAKVPDEPTVFYGGDPSAALGRGWRLSMANTFGEFDARVFFTTVLGDRKKASAIAAGWDGGRFWFCERESAPGFVGVMSTWDTEKDALEFARAWAAWAVVRDRPGEKVDVRLMPDPKKETRVQADVVVRVFRVETGDGLVVVRVEGRDVVVADGVPKARAENVLGVMAAARRTERRAAAQPPS